MTPRIPQLAVVVGVILALPFGAFAFYSTGDFLAATLTALALFYPMAAYTIYNSEDPTVVLPTRPIVFGAIVLAWVLAMHGLLGGELLEGLFVALAVLLPASAYYTRYDRAGYVMSTRVILSVGSWLALLIVGTGVLYGQFLLAAVDAGLVYLAAALYYARGGGKRVNPLSPRTTVGLCVGFSILIAVNVVLIADVIWPGVLSALAPVACALLYYRFAEYDPDDRSPMPESEHPIS